MYYYALMEYQPLINIADFSPFKSNYCLNSYEDENFNKFLEYPKLLANKPLRCRKPDKNKFVRQKSRSNRLNQRQVDIENNCWSDVFERQECSYKNKSPSLTSFSEDKELHSNSNSSHNRSESKSSLTISERKNYLNEVTKISRIKNILLKKICYPKSNQQVETSGGATILKIQSIEPAFATLDSSSVCVNDLRSEDQEIIKCELGSCPLETKSLKSLHSSEISSFKYIEHFPKNILVNESDGLPHAQLEEMMVPPTPQNSIYDETEEPIMIENHSAALAGNTIEMLRSLELVQSFCADPQSGTLSEIESLCNPISLKASVSVESPQEQPIFLMHTEQSTVPTEKIVRENSNEEFDEALTDIDEWVEFRHSGTSCDMPISQRNEYTCPELPLFIEVVKENGINDFIRPTNYETNWNNQVPSEGSFAEFLSVEDESETYHDLLSFSVQDSMSEQLLQQDATSYTASNQDPNDDFEINNLIKSKSVLDLSIYTNTESFLDFPSVFQSNSEEWHSAMESSYYSSNEYDPPWSCQDQTEEQRYKGEIEASPKESESDESVNGKVNERLIEKRIDPKKYRPSTSSQGTELILRKLSKYE